MSDTISQDTFHLGANIDERPQVQKDQDYHADEVAGAPAVVPFAHPKPTELKATIFNQWYVGSCVPHGFLTQLEYEGILPPELAAQLVTYRQRSNYPQAGSIATDIYDKLRAGIKAHSFFPTPEGFTEAQATAMPLTAGEKILKDFNYFQITNYGTVPGEVAAGKAVSIFIYATTEEWSQEYVEAKETLSITDSRATVRHCVCLVPEGDFMENGKQWLTVHDSAWFGGRSLRYISLNFLLTRAFYAGKVYATGTLPTPPAPVATLPTTPCQYGDRGSAAVEALQAFLVKEGKLDAQYVTGNYLALTAKAVLWWQLEHWEKFSVNVPQLLDWAGKYWGEQSIAIIRAS